MTTRRTKHRPGSPFGLTPTEVQVIQAVCSDKTLDELAAETGYSSDRYTAHLVNIRRKLRVRTTRGAVVAWLTREEPPPIRRSG